MKNVTIGPLTAGEGCRPLVIAEAGINHNGHMDIAMEMVKVAKEAGADIVKFQTHLADAEMLCDKDMSGEAGSHVTRSLYDIMSECSLTIDDHRTLQAYADELGIVFLSTPFSIEAADLLEEINVPAFKIGSGEITNIPFLKHVASKGKPMILSTGTADWDELVVSVKAVGEHCSELVVLQCTSNYPTPYSEVNLGVMDRIRSELDLPSGLSDHCTGNYACFGAVARGASIVEKHFTLSRKLPGIDQGSSIEPDELADLVAGVRGVYESMGKEKVLNEEALKVRHGFSESIVTLTPIKAGDELQERVNVWVKRPGSGIPSYKLPEYVGKKVVRELPADYLLTPEDVV